MREWRWLLRALSLAIIVPTCSSGTESNGFREEAARQGEVRLPLAVRYVDIVWSYRYSGEMPYWKASENPEVKPRWTPEEVVQLLEDFPDFYVSMGGWGLRPTGDQRHLEMGRVIDEVQALARRLGVHEATSRLMVGIRNDVYRKFRRGWQSCTPCDGDGECRDLCTWEGALVDAPFDPAWIATVPRSEHLWSVDRLWGGSPRKDPWSEWGADRWPSWFDREAVAAVNTESRVVALYGGVHDLDPSEERTEWAPRVSAVVMDLRNPDYRAWSVKRLIANLQVMGIDPGEAAVVQYPYKPGWHTYYAGPNSGDRCFVEGSHMWTGPSNRCDGGSQPPGGPLVRTPYGPGEFEEALNLMLKEFRTALVAAGYEKVGIVTTEHPRYEHQNWSVLDPETREASWLIGEIRNSCDRTDLTSPPDPIRCGRD